MKNEQDIFADAKWNFETNDVASVPDDYFGNVHLGALCFDFVKHDDFVSLDCYILGHDTGYGYTKKGEIPYDFIDGTSCESDVSSIDDFKVKATSAIEKWITENPHLYSDVFESKIKWDDVE